MKKILQINVLNETGSTGRIMQSISKSIEASNKYISFTAFGYGTSKKENSYKIGSKLEYNIHNLMSRIFCAQGTFSYFATKRFTRYLLKIKPDLIHLHNIHGNYINYKVLFKFILKHNIPVVWTLHDCWPFTGKCTYFDLCQCEKWKDYCVNCPILKEYPTSYFLDKSKKQFMTKKDLFSKVNNMYFVTPSEWLANLVKESFLSKYPVRVINNGIDLSQFHYYETNIREKYDLENKKIILGVASPWSDRKGLKDFILLSKLIDNNTKIVLIGINDRIKQILPKEILGIERTDSVRELAEWYSTADVFVNPTYEDNFPTVNLESLACNTPIVTYNTGGSVEVINNFTGLISKKGDINDMFIKINDIFINIDKYKNCSKFASKFDDSTIFDQYIDLYNEILDD